MRAERRTSDAQAAPARSEIFCRSQMRPARAASPFPRRDLLWEKPIELLKAYRLARASGRKRPTSNAEYRVVSSTFDVGCSAFGVCLPPGRHLLQSDLHQFFRRFRLAL